MFDFNMLGLPFIEGRYELPFSTTYIKPQFLSMPLIKLDLVEDTNNYRVTAELPGVREEDLSIDINSNNEGLTISAKRADVKHSILNKLCISESELWGSGVARRTILLPVDSDYHNARAKYVNGLLNITIPKKESTKVPISVEPVSFIKNT